MHLKSKIISAVSALALAVTGISVGIYDSNTEVPVSAAVDVSMDWGAVRIGGGGFVSSIVTGKKTMIARTDVGGAYKYNYETESWDQLLAFLNEADRGLLSVSAVAIDPTDDDTFYMLCGCAYFSDARTEIFKTTDGGKTFKRIDVTDLIQVHANGYGRQCGEPMAVDPDNPNIIYAGGGVTPSDSALIWSQDGGETWEPVMGYADMEFGEGESKRHYFEYSVKWPVWVEDHIVKAATLSTEGPNDYAAQNGIAAIAIEDGKVYVGTSVKGIPNVVTATVGKDDYEVLSSELPEDAYPAKFVSDGAGNLLITYMTSIMLDKPNGGIYKYNLKTGSVTDISPSDNAYGGISAAPSDPNKLIASTCSNAPTSQLWYEGAWEDDNVAWGERFFKSEDGGSSWEEITPGNTKTWGGPLMADYIQDGGYEWIRNKAIHWSGAAVIDPMNEDRFFTVSGNGIFRCDKVWSELPVYTFHPTGIEEVVALDMVSVPGGNAFSAIGDYDGFEHSDVAEIGRQYAPNMGSTCAIAYCPQNPDVMVRIAENNNNIAPGFYSLDGGITWTKMSNSPGGKAAITQLDDDTYRIFKSTGSNDKSTSVSYSDDFGKTWNTCEGIPSAYGSKPTNMLVEPDHPNIVYAYLTFFNESYFYSKPAPTAEDAQYKLCVSTDYGATFTSTDVCMYDQCDSAGRIAYLGEGELALGGGYYGMYHASISMDNGKATISKMDGVSYCKTVGYGAPEKKGDVNTLYMYGRPEESDPEGIYRSTDGGKTWLCINIDKIYGGTGNGNFLVGDMNEFGKVYMSTVGCGIIYGCLSDEPLPTDPTEATDSTEKVTTAVKPTESVTTETKVTEKPTEASTEATTEVTTEDTDKPTAPTPNDKVKYGDVDCNELIESLDVVMLNRYLLDTEKNTLSEQSLMNANCEFDEFIDLVDSGKLINYVAEIITQDKLGPQTDK